MRFRRRYRMRWERQRIGKARWSMVDGGKGNGKEHREFFLFNTELFVFFFFLVLVFFFFFCFIKHGGALFNIVVPVCFFLFFFVLFFYFFCFIIFFLHCADVEICRGFKSLHCADVEICRGFKSFDFIYIYID